MKRAVVLDVCTLLRTPVFKPLMLVYLAHRAGAEVICRSYLGRSTTKKLLRMTNVLHLMDDFLWNDASAPEHAYEVSGPDDELLQLAGRELTSQLNYNG
jgi:hypothetical protein